MPETGSSAPRARVQPDAPAHPPVETREETIARVMDEQRHVAVEGGSDADPSIRRGVHRVLGRRVLRAAIVAGIVGAVLGVVLYLLPFGPRREGRGLGIMGGSWADPILYAVVLGVGFAVIAGIITALLTLEREDGRIEREVEEQVETRPQGPGRPQPPQRDLPQA